MEPVKYTREDIKNQIEEMRSTFNQTINTMDKVFEMAFELDWAQNMFAVDKKVKNPPKKRATRKKKKDSIDVSVIDVETASD